MIKKERFRPYAAVYAMLLKGGEVFLIRRFNTGWQDGKYTLPSGHMEGDETAAGAAVRELKEEVGVIADEESLAFAHVMHRVHKTNGGREYIDFYLATKKWDHAPHNAEPEKCDDAKWFPLDALPENTISSVRTAIQNYQNGITFSEFGWDGQL